ncbi:MAG TPA: serine/threonine-protein kinase, partial [Acidobacteriota bacterium]|nr:serine/threonine-protein kinase [Acidobacteriota bacterium]
MGEVYLAEDTKLKREVALKVLPFNRTQDKKALQRFKSEALSAAALHHPNICMIHEMGESDGRFFIAMELCEGETLLHRIESSNLNVDDVLAIALQLAEGLEEARAKNIVHRDIKSSNIMIT